jgi:hypothetical protein
MNIYAPLTVSEMFSSAGQRNQSSTAWTDLCAVQLTRYLSGVLEVRPQRGWPPIGAAS